MEDLTSLEAETLCYDAFMLRPLPFNAGYANRGVDWRLLLLFDPSPRWNSERYCWRYYYYGSSNYPVKSLPDPILIFSVISGILNYYCCFLSSFAFSLEESCLANWRNFFWIYILLIKLLTDVCAFKAFCNDPVAGKSVSPRFYFVSSSCIPDTDDPGEDTCKSIC